jgi:hypothetical protein
MKSFKYLSEALTARSAFLQSFYAANSFLSKILFRLLRCPRQANSSSDFADGAPSKEIMSSYFKGMKRYGKN